MELSFHEKLFQPTDTINCIDVKGGRDDTKDIP